MIKIWYFLVNVFLNATKKSFRLGLRICKIHDSALKSKSSDAFILNMYNTFHIICEAYKDAYGTWIAKRNMQQGATLAFNKLIAELGNAKINAWDAAIASVYSKGSAAYKALLPNGHKPFQQGSQEDRIASLNGLIIAIGSDVALATLKTELIAFYKAISDADDYQKQLMSDVQTSSNLLEQSRVSMCVAMYADLGGLMQYFATNALSIESFFDLKGIRRGQQVLFMGTVKHNSIKKIVQKTVLPTDQLMLENTGVTDLSFYLSATKDGAMGATFVTMAAGKTITVTAADLGDATTQHFLMVSNSDAVNSGEFTVEFV